jgi:perosamine synthetase
MSHKIERIGELERRYVNEVLDSQFRASMGSLMTSRLEKAFAQKFDQKYAICFVNGTATMHAALIGAGIGPGDEVIVPPLTMASTTFAVLQAGAVPVFADIDPKTFVISSKSIEERITSYTKGIIPVSLFGLSPDMDPIMALAEQHDLFVLEDAAECFLGKYKGRLVGTLGHASSFSFQSTKHITSGEGGIVLTNDLDVALETRRFNSLGYAGIGADKGKINKKDIQDPNYSRHVSIGYNYRMPELCSAVALGQFERIDSLVDRRQQVAQLFSSVIDECSWMTPQKTGDDYVNSFWAYAVLLEHPNITWHQFRDTFCSLGGDGIYAAWKLTYLEPMFADGCPGQHPHYQGHYQKYEPGLCPNAEAIQPKLLQFKTDYWDWDEAKMQMDILRKTISHFN